MKNIFLLSVIVLVAERSYAYDLYLSLKDPQEIQRMGGIITGGEITSEGFVVRQAGGKLVIPLGNVNPVSGFASIKIKNVPSTWPHEPDNCANNDQAGWPWGVNLFGMGISPDDLWEGEQGAGVVWSYYLRCDLCDPGYRGIFRHLLRGQGNWCGSTPVYYSHWCGDRNEVVVLKHEWSANKGGTYQLYENEEPMDMLKSDGCGILQRANWYIHLGYQDGGDITGAVFWDLVVHFDDVSNECGNNICEVGEDCSTCPADCSCKEPCYVCKNGSCECNSPNYECPSCKPSCGEAGRLNSTEVICCGSGFTCEFGKRVFDTYDCNTCCEGNQCIPPGGEEDGGYSDVVEDVKMGDIDIRDTNQMDGADVNDFDIVIEDVVEGDRGVVIDDVGEDVEINEIGKDVGIARDAGTVKDESSGCGCTVIN